MSAAGGRGVATEALARGGVRPLILTWHSVSEDRPPLAVAPERLARDLDALLSAGFEGVSLDALVRALSDTDAEGALPARPLVLTFDDGYRDFTEHALPVLETRGLPATLFATAGADRAQLPGGTAGPLLPLDALAGLAGCGVTVGAHSVGHVDLTALDDAALAKELAGSRAVLEAHAGAPVEHFAYPFGRLDARVRAAAARVFRSACTTRLARVRPGEDDLLALPRIDAHYLRSPLLRWLLAADAPDAWLGVRRRLRQWRGSEPTFPRGATPCPS